MSEEVQHFFEIATFTSPTQCVICKTFIWGQVKQGFCCKGCHANVHKKCVDSMKSIKCDPHNPQLNTAVTMQPILMKKAAPPSQPLQASQQNNTPQPPARPSSGSASSSNGPAVPPPARSSPTPGRVQIQVNPVVTPIPKRTGPPNGTPPGTPPPGRLAVPGGSGSRPNSGNQTPVVVPVDTPMPQRPAPQMLPSQPTTQQTQSTSHPSPPQRPAPNPTPSPAATVNRPPQGPPPAPKRSSLGPHPSVPARDPSPQPRPDREPPQPVKASEPVKEPIKEPAKIEPVQSHHAQPQQPSPVQLEMEKVLKSLQESILKNQQTLDSQEFTINVNTKNIELQQSTLANLQKQVDELNKQKSLLESQIKDLNQERSRSASKGQATVLPRVAKSNSLGTIPDVKEKVNSSPLSQSDVTGAFYNTPEDNYNNTEDGYNNADDVYNNNSETIKIVDYGAKIRALPCYFGSITRQVAEQILAGFGPNYYLVRDSSVQDSFAVSFILGTEFNHTLVTTTYTGIKFVDADAICNSLEELLANNEKLFGLIPLEKSAFEQTHKPISIRIPEANQTASIPQDSPLLVKDLIKTLAHKASLKNADEFGIYIPEEHQWLANDKLFSSVHFENIKEGLIMQRKTRLYLVVRIGGKELTIDVKKDASVKEAIEVLQKQIKANPTLATINTSNYGLFMISDKVEDGIPMQESKSVRSYKMKLSDKLEFKEKEDKEKNSFFIIVDSPAHGYSQTLKFKGDPLVKDILLEFVSKNPIENPGSYGLVKIDNAKKNLNLFQRGRSKQELMTWLDPARPLSFYNLKSMDIICFKQRMRHRTVSRLDGVVKKQWFGVDPSSIENEMDPSNGIVVPTILITLKGSLVKHGGLQREGIFRIAGSESRIKDIKYELNTNLFKDTSEVDCVASLLKRWFGELPTRLFSSLTMTMLEGAVDDIDETMNLINKLPEKEKSLYMWLLDLMFSVAQYEDINKMTPENIAICVAPQLMDNQAENPMEAILTNQKLCAIVANSIIWKKKQLEQESDASH